MADYEIEVDVAPDASRFHRDLSEQLREEERRANTVGVELDPKVTKEFRTKATRSVRKALKDLDAAVTVSPEVTKAFRRDLQRAVKEVTRGEAIEVPVAPTLGRTFRRDLQRMVKEAVATKPIEVGVTGKAGPGFRAKLQKSITEALAAKPLTANVNLQVSKRGYADFVKDVVRASAEATATAERTGAADVKIGVDAKGIGPKIAAEVGAATRSVSASEAASVEIRTDTNAATAGVSNLAGHVRKVLLPVLLLAAGAITGVFLAFGAATAITANFESQLSDLQATAGLTASQMGELRQQAIDAGRDTVFSASEAAEAQTELAKAGASVEQILSGGLNASLSLAAAGSIELADAATFVATGLNTFGLGADEASRVADTLAAAANKSATDIPQLGLAMQQSGLVAKSYGLSIEDTAGALALFAQNGLTGSDAGTSFKTMLLGLNPSSKEAAALMKEIGFSAYDAEGNFIGLEAVAGELQTSLAGMSEEQRNATLKTLFGTDAIRAANLIYKAGPTGINEWTGAVTDAGFASDVAATKLDNLKGDLEGLKGSFETAFIEAGTGGQSGLRQTVQALTGVVNTIGPLLSEALLPVADLITQLTPEFGKLLVAVIPLLGSMGELAGPILGALVRILIAVAPYVDDLLQGLQPIARAVLSILEAFTPLLPVLGEVGSELLAALLPALEELRDPEFIDAVIELAKALAEMLVAVLPLVPLLVKLAVPVATLVVKMLAFKPLLYGVVAGLVAYQAATAAATFVTGAFSAASAGFALNPIGLAVAAIVALGVGIFVAYKKIKPFRELVDSIGRFFRDTLAPAIVDVGKGVARWLVSTFRQAQDLFDKIYPTARKLFGIFVKIQFGPLLKLGQALAALFSGDFDGFKDKLLEAVTVIPAQLLELGKMILPVLGKIGEWLITEGVPLLVRKYLELWGAIFGAIVEYYPKAVMFVAGLIGKIGAWIITEGVPMIAEKASGLATAFLGWIVRTAVTLPIELAKLLAYIILWLGITAVQLGAKALELATGFLGWVRDAAAKLPGQLANLALGIYNWITTTVPELAIRAVALGGAFLGWIGSVLAALPGKLAEIATGIFTWITELPGKVIDLITVLGPKMAEVGTGLITALFDGIVGLAGLAGDIAGDVGGAILDFINENVIDAINESLEFDFKVKGIGISINPPNIPHLAFAEGGIVRRPTLALIGEAGDELVLPLSDPARMAQLIAQAGLELPIPTAASGAPATAAAAATGALAGQEATTSAAPDVAGLTAWVEAAVAVMATVPGLVLAATIPGLIVWELEVERVLALFTAAELATTTTSRARWYQWATYDLPLATLPGLALWRSAVAAQLTAFQENTVAQVTSTSARAAMAWQTGLDTMALAAATGGQRIGDALVGALEEASTRIMKVVTGYRDDLADAMNPILQAAGQPKLKLAKGGEAKMARGGYVPGPDVRRDVVPAMLMPGEVVIRRDSVDRFGVDNLLRINAGQLPPGWKAPGYAEGGVVTGDTEGLNGEFMRRLSLWSGALGETYNVRSGYRSMAEQAALYAKYLNGTGNLAAPPGSSMHNFGLASDGNHWRNRNPGLFGLRFTVPSEAWHVEPVEAREWARNGVTEGGAGGYGGIPGMMPFPEAPGTDKLGKGALADTAAALMGFTREKALAWASSVQFDAPGTLEPGGGGSAGSAAAAAWVRQAMALAGVGPEWFTGLMTIAQRESNFDPTAVNGWDSNAAKGTPSKGIMQMIDPTFRANMLPGMSNIFDPVSNIAAAIRYIQARYGSIANVQQANPNLPPKGYALGGLVTAEAMRSMAGDTIGLSRPTPPGAPWADGGTTNGAKVNVEGDLKVEVTPPGSHDPESYAAALGHRAVPILAAVADRTS